MDKQEVIDRHFLRLAWVTAIDLSKDPNTSVGSVIVTPDFRQQSIGYNGFVKGLPESNYLWQREHKYERVIHAELNSIINCPFDTKDCFMYTTHRPCHRCLGHAVNAGIVRVVYNDEYDTPQQNINVWNEIAKLLKEVKKIEDDEFLIEIKTNKLKYKLALPL